MRWAILVCASLSVAILLSCNGAYGKRVKTKTKTFLTEYTKQKRKYCDFKGFHILPGSKWSTPMGCQECVCTQKFMKCKPIRKSKRRRMKITCL